MGRDRGPFRWIARLCWGSAVFGLAVAVNAQEYEDGHMANVASINGGPRDYRERYTGVDELPYTDDDMVVPGENMDGMVDLLTFPGGVWFGGTIRTTGVPSAPVSLNSPGGPNTYYFYTHRADDDDSYEWASNGRLWDGRVSESEYWSDNSLLGIDLEALGISSAGWEYELNDNPNWDGQNNAGLYNNARANQHGQGNPIYYFDVSNTDPLNEEHRRYVTGGTNRSMSTAGALAGSENRFAQIRRNDNTDDAIRRTAWTRGFVIPVHRIPDLQDGELGDAAWHASAFPNHAIPNMMDVDGDGTAETPFDLAGYVRDVLGPVVTGPDPNLFAWSGENASGRHGTGVLQYVMILRSQVPISLRGNFADPADRNAQTAALYGANHGDLTTFTAICLADGSTDGQPRALVFDPPQGVQYNAVAFENFQPFRGRSPLDAGTAFDGELRHHFDGELSNPYVTVMGNDTGASDDGVVAALGGGESDAQLHLGIGGISEDRVWNTSRGPAYAETRVRLFEDEPRQELHLVLERSNRPVAWAILRDGQAPVLGVGGGVMRDLANGNVHSGVEVPSHDGSPQAFVDGSGVSQLNTEYADYLLGLDAANKTVRLWLGDGDGANNLLAEFAYTGTAGDDVDTSQIDGMRLWTGPNLIDENDPADPEDDDLAKELQVDSLGWGYDALVSAAPVFMNVMGGVQAAFGAPADTFVSPLGDDVPFTQFGLTTNLPLETIAVVGSDYTAGGTAPTVDSFVSNGDGTHQVTLDSPLTPGHWLKLTLEIAAAGSASNTVDVWLAHQLLDINQDGMTNIRDATAFGEVFNDGKAAVLVDINGDGEVNIRDATAFGEIWNGVSGTAWRNTSLPARP